jgi:dolichyl-diphosphooligosaccharide--protein glycosyltransferase
MPQTEISVDMTDGSRVAELLADRPDFEDALEAVHTVDGEHDTWTFDDVPIDSGTFGQLVSEGVVEKDDGEYRLANPDAVRAALDGEPEPASPTDDGTSDRDFSPTLPSVDGRGVGLLAAALAFFAAVRLYPLGGVFRDGAVVLSGNDPYYYRYWVEQTLADGTVGAVPLGAVPESIAGGEPFLVAALTWLSNLLGSGLALALYPVLAGLLVALMVYLLAVRVSDDRRVALASVALLAVTPGFAFRTSLGYADHHAFDYLWLALTALALVVLLTGERDVADPTRWLAGVGLGVGVAGQVLAWDNGPLLVVPVAAVVAIAVLFDVRADRSPLRANAPLIGGLGLAAVATFGVHSAVGWHTTTVASIPALVFAGSAVIVAVGEAAARLERDVRELLVLEAVASVGTFAALVVFAPDYWTELQGGIDTILAGRNIAETQSLFNDAVGFMLIFGFILVVAVPVLVWVTGRLPRNEAWLVPVVYGWYFLGLATFQIRFVGELAPFTAVLAGLGFVWLAAWVDLADLPTPVGGEDRTDWWPPRPDASTVVAVIALFALVAGLSAIQSGVKMQQVAIEDDTYETAAYLADYADDRGWANESESYVFSDWGRNRVYNYFVNGQSRSYGYAQTNYRDFVRQTDPSAAAATTDRARFVVTKPFPVEDDAMGARLHDHFGSRDGGTDGLANYRAIYATESGDRKAFLVVPGATLDGTTTPNATVTLSTNVSVPGADFAYERQVQTNATGAFSVTVANPGTYDLRTDEQEWTVEVSEAGVMNGTGVAAGSS